MLLCLSYSEEEQSFIFYSFFVACKTRLRKVFKESVSNNREAQKAIKNT